MEASAGAPGPRRLEVVLIGEEDRRVLTPTEVERFGGVGRVWNARHGYGVAVFRDTSVSQNPVTASLLGERLYAVTAAHFFYQSGELKSPLAEIRFGHGDFAAGRVQTYRVVDIEAGTIHPEQDPQRDFAILRLDRPAPAHLAVLELRPFRPRATLSPRLSLVAYHGDIDGGSAPRVSAVELEEKSERRLAHGAPWYNHPEIVIYGGRTEGGSSGAPLISVGDGLQLYLEALNLGYIRCSSWQDGHGFNPVCHFNYGIRVVGNRDFYFSYRRLSDRSGAPEARREAG